MNFVFYDLETTGKNKDWSQIIQFGSICTNENLDEIDRYESKCRLKTGVVPEPEALFVNNNSINDLYKVNLSHYELIKEIKSKFKEWSPAIFIGFNSIQFDEEILRKSFFKSLLDTYITQLDGNKRADLMNIARTTSFYFNDTLKTLINNKGKKSFRLEDLAEANQINHQAHDAMGDVLATLKLAVIIKDKQSNLWEQCIHNSYKKDVENYVFQNKIFCLNEFNFGQMNAYALTYLCMHPKYGYLQCYDLTIDPIEIINLNYADLKKRIKEKPILIKTIPHNKHPLIFDKSYLHNIDKFKKINFSLLNDRADLIKSNEDFKKRLVLILNEQAEEKELQSSQLEILAEESLYYGGFPSFKDKIVMEEFHNVSWLEKFKISNKFEDERFKYFAQKIIYEESPETLPKEIFNKIHKTIANQILTLEDVNWFTLPKAYKQIDDLRVKFLEKNEEEKLNFLLEINNYLEKMQKTYEPAKYL